MPDHVGPHPGAGRRMRRALRARSRTWAGRGESTETSLCKGGGMLAPRRHRLGPLGQRQHSLEVEGLALLPGSWGQILDYPPGTLGT